MGDYQQHTNKLKDAIQQRTRAAEDLRVRWPGDPGYAQGLEALARDAAAREQVLGRLDQYGGKAYRCRAACHQARDHERVVGVYVTWPGMPANVDQQRQQELEAAHRALDDKSRDLRAAVADLLRHLETDHTGADLGLDDLVQDSKDLVDPACPPTGDDVIDHLRDADKVLAKAGPSDDQAKTLADNWAKAIELLGERDGDKETELRAAVDELAVHQLAAPLFARLAAAGQKAGA